MIVTIDGPAGAGKSSAARALALRLGYRFLDTGAFYRSVTLAAVEQKIDFANADLLQKLAKTCDIQVDDNRVFLNGREVTDAIRTFDITTATRFAADHPGVRHLLVEMQRNAVAGCDVVTEGRDQATVVFPNAECKIFLTASEEIRAQRRHEDLLNRGEQIAFEDVLLKQQQRDERDTNRLVGALIKAKEAVEVNTDGLSPSEVVDRLAEVVGQVAGQMK